MERELSAIRLSAYGNAFFGLLGTAFGLWLDSSAILLDGIFNWISFGMALISIKVARLLHRPGSDLFPFGYAAFEPMVNTVKAMLVLGVSVFAFWGAVNTVLDGGQELAAGWAVVYAVIAVGGCFGIAAIQSRVARQAQSPLVAVDAKNWFINGAISSAVGFAFVLALFLQGSPVVPYIDSSLVILLVLVTIPIPLRMAIEGIGELLAVRPPDELMAQLDESLRKAIGENGRLERLRANQLGRTVVLIADTEVEQGRTAAELEAVQRSVEEQMRRSFPHLLMAIVFRTGSA
ncbi:MAG: cation diffusion facilitator family transporter [Planctomycetota bacterium]|jgi:cation diffusion facilitator family transporter